MELDLEEFKDRWQLTPEQLRRTKLSSEDLDISQKVLLDFEDKFIENISDWSLEEAFFLYEEDEDYICRFYQFSKGLTKCFIIISTKPEIEVCSSNMDSRLLAQISNILLNWIVDCVKDIRK